jgi:hypothetical protein
MDTFENVLRKYLGIFANQEMYFVNDIRKVELFEKVPSNTNAEDIRSKVSAVNDHDINQFSILNEMVDHILKLSIDDKIKKGDLSVVDEIASIEVRGTKHNLLHFASVYCNFHRPDIFPIYSEQHFDFYRTYIKRYKLPLDVEKLNTYVVFSRALKDLISRLGLEKKMNYLQMRKFGWLYAETVLKESAPEPVH